MLRRDRQIRAQIHQLADAIGARNRDELADRLTREGCIFSFVASPPEVEHVTQVVKGF